MDDDTFDCPACDGSSVYLGTLGRLAWCRCRDCGIEWNMLAESLPEPIQPEEI